MAAYLRALRPQFRDQQLLLLSTGMRLGEAEQLRVLNVRGDDLGMRLSIEDAKTQAGVRSVFVPDWAANAVRRLIFEGGLSPTDRLFNAKRRSIQAEHDRACIQAKIPEYTIHDHRHTAAVALARAGMPLPLLQTQLGHKHIEMTMKYAQFHPSYSDLAPHFAHMGKMLGLSVVGAQKPDRGDTLGDSAPEALALGAA